jgi:hypothetical protein
MAGFHRSLQAGAMIEGEQHVIDRRTVGHIGVSLRARSRSLPSSHETAVLSTLRLGGIGCGETGKHRIFTRKGSRAAQRYTPFQSDKNLDPIQPEFQGLAC